MQNDEDDLSRVDGLPKPDQHSELPRVSPVCSEQGLPEEDCDDFEPPTVNNEVV